MDNQGHRPPSLSGIFRGLHELFGADVGPGSSALRGGVAWPHWSPPSQAASSQHCRSSRRRLAAMATASAATGTRGRRPPCGRALPASVVRGPRAVPIHRPSGSTAPSAFLGRLRDMLVGYAWSVDSGMEFLEWVKRVMGSRGKPGDRDHRVHRTPPRRDRDSTSTRDPRSDTYRGGCLGDREVGRKLRWARCSWARTAEEAGKDRCAIDPYCGGPITERR